RRTKGQQKDEHGKDQADELRTRSHGADEGRHLYLHAVSLPGIDGVSEILLEVRVLVDQFVEGRIEVHLGVRDFSVGRDPSRAGGGGGAGNAGGLRRGSRRSDSAL